LCVNKSQFVPVIFEPPWIIPMLICRTTVFVTKDERTMCYFIYSCWLSSRKNAIKLHLLLRQYFETCYTTHDMLQNWQMITFFECQRCMFSIHFNAKWATWHSHSNQTSDKLNVTFSLSTPWRHIGSWVGPKVGLDDMDSTKISCPYRNFFSFVLFFFLSSGRLLLLLLPLALQPAVGFGLSNNILPFFPICRQLSPSLHS
jgi:hypothetical protein